MTELAEQIEAQSSKPKKQDRLMLMLEGHKQQFARSLLNADGTPMIAPDKFVRLAITTARTVPKLAQATDISLLGCLMTCAQLGLEPGGPLGQAWILPYEDRKKNTVEAQLIIGYQGYIDLMYRSDRVAAVSADVIKEADYFQFEKGTNAHLIHRPQLEDRGEVIAVYGIAELVTGAKPFDVLARSEIDKRRAMSPSGKSEHSPWAKHYDAMARKTAIRQLFKWIPSSVEFQAAQAADGATFKDIPERIDDVPDVIDVDEIEDDGDDE